MFKICFSRLSRANAKRKRNNHVYSQGFGRPIHIESNRAWVLACALTLRIRQHNLLKIQKKKNTDRFPCWMIPLSTQSAKGMWRCFFFVSWCVTPSRRRHYFSHFVSLRRERNTKAKRYELFNNAHNACYILYCANEAFEIRQLAKCKTENLSFWWANRGERERNERNEERDERMQILLLLMRIHVPHRLPSQNTEWMAANARQWSGIKNSTHASTQSWWFVVETIGSANATQNRK